MDNVGGVEQPKRYVAIFYVLAALALGVFLEKVLQLVMNAAGWNDRELISDFGWNVSTFIGFAIAAISAVVVWRIPKTQQVSLEIALELRRVTWPSLRETRASTIAVVVASAIAAVILGVFDFAWGWLSGKLY
jgi:preprotein translocase subunit SecE